ncbi:helix-hairpin-helix domain-containing protein [uncultured Mailhella sp.]|uniref:ComEA family DNA-binding protein n=1 Tax=uncultured Mailhella sp. TaxID=1981031 RepID=UPI0026168CD1|nr:helix-hairpin-helix domain-containing protein [uncultured Mailhella sp.]
MDFKRFFACFAVAALCFTTTAYAAEKANLNSATEEELAADPAIGPDLAAKIVEYRGNVGDFTSYEELKEVEGITDTKIKEINEHFEIKGVASFDCNC